MMSHELLINLAAVVALLGLMAYAVLGGADFGGGIWDLFAMGPRRAEQRAAIARAMGPVWEANHVWLIFVIVVLFTCFPYGYAPLATALFVPLHLALLGIMLRGASFVFRGQLIRWRDPAVVHDQFPSVWGTIFGVASVISPLVLGMAFGAVTIGTVIRVRGDGTVVFAGEGPLPWLMPYAILCGLLALSACAYLAAVYLTSETTGALREDFRRRALGAGITTAALAAAVLVMSSTEADWFFRQLTEPRSAPILFAGLACFALSAWHMFRRRFLWSRLFAASEILFLLLGWGVAQYPYLIYPDVTLQSAAAPPATIGFMLATVPVGGLLLLPSLWLLMKVFKGNGVSEKEQTPTSEPGATEA